MEHPFEHLLGLNAQSALAILASYGIVDVTVTPTAAPPLRRRSAPPVRAGGSAAADARLSAPVIPERPAAPGEPAAPERPAPPAREAPDGDPFTEARVVAVRDDGHTLIVSRFRVGEPSDAPDASRRRVSHEGNVL